MRVVLVVAVVLIAIQFSCALRQEHVLRQGPVRQPPSLGDVG
jgi:hypothetical protein